jgi:sucrose-phosphate synthase
VKRERLLSAGRKASALERQFSFERRIAAEEAVLEHASLIVASTRQELHEQYALYESFDARRATVIAPGADLSRFGPPRAGAREERAAALVDRFLASPAKPLILALCRPVEQKNVRRLLAAYAQDAGLRGQANLAIVSGSRDDVRAAEEEQRRVFTDLILDIDAFDLYGHVALPKRHASEDVPELYRLAARRRGVFVDVAVNEPFGLTLLEAAASGLPVVATEDGGPREIVETCGNGFLVDPLDTGAIARALTMALSDPKGWRRRARSGLAGVARHYTWEGHVAKYLRSAGRLLRRERKQIRRRIAYSRPEAEPSVRPFRYALISDIDETLVGSEPGLEALLAWLSGHREDVAFGVATGRVLGLAIGVLEDWGVPVPDVLVTAVGAEIHYGPRLVSDEGWARHIRRGWRREALLEALASVPGLSPQPDVKQGAFKLSFDVEKGRPSPVPEVEGLLRARGLHARVIFSQGAYLDVLPFRASKGLAIRYLAYRHGVPLRNFLVAGDSGNDTEMLVGDTLAVVVGNHKPELEALRESDQVYFAGRHYADGILEGIAHYGFVGGRTPEPREVPCSTS